MCNNLYLTMFYFNMFLFYCIIFNSIIYYFIIIFFTQIDLCQINTYNILFQILNYYVNYVFYGTFLLQYNTIHFDIKQSLKYFIIRCFDNIISSEIKIIYF